MQVRLKLIIVLLISINVSFAEFDFSDIGTVGKKAYDKHQKLIHTILPTYNIKLKKQVNSGIEALTHLTFFNDKININGKSSVAIPHELNPYIFDFKSLEVIGKNLKNIEKIVVDSGGGGNPVLVITSQTENLIQIKVSSFRCSLQNPLYLVFEGNGLIEKIEFVHREGIATKFDPSIYIEPGLSKPVLPVKILINASALRSIEGICEIKPERYFRYYAMPNADRSGKEPFFRGKGFLPGRQLVELGPAYEDRYGAADAMNYLKEDPLRSGYGDPNFFEEEEFWQFEGVDPELEFVLSFNSWPKFMYPTNFPGVSNQRGTPAIDKFDAAADLCVMYLKSQIRDSGRTANWWEIKNESDVKSEWIYHEKEGYDSWQLLANFHNIIANSIHDEIPNVKVGGPTSAWLVPYAGDFKVWKNHVRFMDLTKEHLDFYSHHFYEIGSMDSYQRVKNEGHSYLQGGFECSVDMICAHMNETKNIKPLICSEYGSLNFVRDDRGYWMHIKNINAFMLNFLDRPNDFSIAVPFMLSFMHWAPDSLETFIHQSPDGEFIKTKNTFILDMWSGFKGKRIPCRDTEHKVLSHAVIDEDTIRLAVNNRSGRRILLEIDSILPKNKEIVSIRQRKAFFDKGETQFINESLLSLKNIELGIDVTSIYEIKLNDRLNPKKLIDENLYYGLGTALNIDRDVEINIPVGQKKIDASILRIGLHKSGGIKENILVELNGHIIEEKDLSFSKGTPNYMDYFEIDVNPKLIKDNNILKVYAKEDGVTLTSARIKTFASK